MSYDANRDSRPSYARSMGSFDLAAAIAEADGAGGAKTKIPQAGVGVGVGVGNAIGHTGNAIGSATVKAGNAIGNHIGNARSVIVEGFERGWQGGVEGIGKATRRRWT